MVQLLDNPIEQRFIQPGISWESFIVSNSLREATLPVGT
jgi:hypothetical protein